MKQKILFLSYMDHLGAGAANVNIAKAMISVGHEVQFLTVIKKSTESFVSQVSKTPQPYIQPSFFSRNTKRIKNILFRKKTEAAPAVKQYNSDYCYFNEDESQSEFTLQDILRFVNITPDIVIGGWISLFINLETLGEIASHFNAKAYVLMNDMAHLTGGCHYTWNCLGYTENCENCPALGENTMKDQSSANLQTKMQSIRKYNIQIIAGSAGNIIEARSSTLYKNQDQIKAINGILNFDLINPKKRKIAKQVFDIPQDKKVVLSGASYIYDPRKGFDKLQDSLHHLNNILIKENKKILYIIVGNDNHYDYNFSHIEVKKMDSVSDKLIFSLLYQAADVFASPSVQDTGPVMVIEALASGTPVVGYQLGFVETYVTDNKNGFVIPKFDTVLFAEKIFYLLFTTDSENFKENSVNSVKDAFSVKQFENFF